MKKTMNLLTNNGGALQHIREVSSINLAATIKDNECIGISCQFNGSNGGFFVAEHIVRLEFVTKSGSVYSIIQVPGGKYVLENSAVSQFTGKYISNIASVVQPVQVGARPNVTSRDDIDVTRLFVGFDGNNGFTTSPITSLLIVTNVNDYTYKLY